MVTKNKVDIWHNILWSKYKGSVFTEASKLATSSKIDLNFFQISVTDQQRLGLGEIDLSYHDYPYELIFRRSYESVGKFRLYFELVRRILRSNANLIVLAGYDRPEYWLQMIFARVRGRRLGVFCDSTSFDHEQKMARGIAKRIFFSQCDLVFCYGQRAREYVQSFGVKPARIVQRVQAAALPRNYSTGDELANRRKMLLDVLPPRFLYVGRLSSEKNVNVLMSAFAMIASKATSPTLALVGTGPEEENLRNLARSLNILDRIEFRGALTGEPLYDQYRRASALILPSEREPWGLVVNEALSYGVPVIVSQRCGCVPELVIPGKTGLIVRAGDIPDLTEKMEEILGPYYVSDTAAKACIDHIATYSPAQAAAQLIDGCVKLLAS